VHQNEIRRVVDEELRRAAPDGWIANLRLQGRFAQVPASDISLAHMEWKLAPAQRTRILENDYRVRVSLDQQAVIFLYGNRDGGPAMPDVEMRAAVINMAKDWQHGYWGRRSLGEYVAYYVSNPHVYPPNTWGYS